MLVLGLETSCDETAAAIVARQSDGSGVILANIVLSQHALHQPYGGVVPEIAARAHVEALDGLIKETCVACGRRLSALDAVAATAGPGLIGGLLVGAMSGKALASVLGKPFLAINHLEGHALTPRLTDGLAFPYLLLLVSGGHTQILLVEGVGAYRRLATTIDDALGEAFDKTAKLLGLPAPGGPAVEHAALRGQPARFTLPRPMLGRAEPYFSFSGLKTAVRIEAERHAPLDRGDTADLCASFQAAILDVLSDRLNQAIDTLRRQNRLPEVLAVAGGVAANRAIAGRLTELANENGLRLIVPPPALCTDNGAMIAWAGAERLTIGQQDGLASPTRARWPLDPEAESAPWAGAKA